jgi:hypothetical protein
LPGASADLPDRPLPAPDCFFYDERFDAARQLAARVSPHAPLTPVRGDITDVWNAGLGERCTRTPLTLRGVTTESFHFCLRVMLASRSRIDTAVTRVDRDLFHWVIHSNGGGSAA